MVFWNGLYELIKTAVQAKIMGHPLGTVMRELEKKLRRKKVIHRALICAKEIRDQKPSFDNFQENEYSFYGHKRT